MISIIVIMIVIQALHMTKSTETDNSNINITFSHQNKILIPSKFAYRTVISIKRICIKILGKVMIKTFIYIRKSFRYNSVRKSENKRYTHSH